MAYRCRNCGKFVARDAAVCKSCNEPNPAVSPEEYNALHGIVKPDKVANGLQGDGQDAPKQNFLSKLTSKKHRNALGCLIVIVIIVVGCLISPMSKTGNNLEQGDQCVFFHDAIGTRTVEDADEVTKIAVDKDKWGLMQMMYDGRAITISKGTVGTYLNSTGGYYKVSIDSRCMTLIVVPGDVEKKK